MPGFHFTLPLASFVLSANHLTESLKWEDWLVVSITDTVFKATATCSCHILSIHCMVTKMIIIVINTVNSMHMTILKTLVYFEFQENKLIKKINFIKKSKQLIKKLHRIICSETNTFILYWRSIIVQSDFSASND